MHINTRPLHNILRLDVQVNDTVRMDVRHGREELSSGSARTAELMTTDLLKGFRGLRNKVWISRHPTQLDP